MKLLFGSTRRFLQKMISPTFVCFTPATLYRTLFEKYFCTSLLALCKCMLSEEEQNCSDRRFTFYDADSALLHKVKSAAAVMSCTRRDVFVTQVNFFGSRQMVFVQKAVDAALRTFHRFKNDDKDATKICLQLVSSQLSTCIEESSFENTPPAFKLCSYTVSFTLFHRSFKQRFSTPLQKILPPYCSLCRVNIKL